MSHTLSKLKKETLETPLIRNKMAVYGWVVLSLIAAGTFSKIWYFSAPPVVKPLQVSGRIEGYETDLAAKSSGRITLIAVREGDTVSRGQVLIKQQDDEVKAQLEGAKARLLAAQQKEAQSALQMQVVESQIQELKIGLKQSQDEATSRIYQAQASLAASQAQFNEAQARLEEALAALKLAQMNEQRFSSLVAQGAIPQQQFDQVQTTLFTAQANVKAKRSSVESFQKLVNTAQGQLQQSQTTAFTPEIRKAQLQSLHLQLGQARLQRTAAQAEQANAQAIQKEVQSRVSDLNIVSPLNGVVVSRSVEPGAVVSAGKTLLTVINPQAVYLRGYVPEGEIGKVKIGQAAKVFLDSTPEQPLNAKVSAIDTQASFTPENIYFKDDRVKVVFGVKISLDNAQGFAKPGMPADAEIIIPSVLPKPQ